MEEQTQRRNTDCLYFLASPLTCKKGGECDYRHSDNARLNPRDCWYWLNGNCRNPNCAFRHPPLEGFDGAKADSFYAPSFSTISANKLNVPCYFYFNAICTKGEQCSYSHNNLSTQKASKVAHELAASHSEENKTSKIDIGPTLGEILVNPLEDILVPAESNGQIKEVPQQLALDCELEDFGSSAESAVPEYEEPVNTLIPSPDFMDQNGQLSPYQSSQGFDVLVDDGSKNLAYEDDADYPLPHNRESVLLHSQLSEYENDGSVSYDHIDYPDNCYLYDKLYEKYDYMDESYLADYLYKNSHLPSEERIFDHRHKHKLLQIVHSRDDAMELQKRHHMSLDACRLPLSSQKRRRSHALSRFQNRPFRYGNKGSVHSRLTTQVEGCMISSSQGEDEYACQDHNRHWRGHLGTSRLPQFKFRERRRRHNDMCTSSEAQQGSVRDADESANSYGNNFAGPKTLAQIKQEKQMDMGGRRNYLPQCRKPQAIVDFEGPKPLAELLKDKSSEVDVWHHETAVSSQERAIVNGYHGYGDANSDDDDVQRKLASIVSN